jgi:hypothetical protein
MTCECYRCGRQEERDHAILVPVHDVRDDATGYHDVIYLCEQCDETRPVPREDAPDADKVKQP